MTSYLMKWGAARWWRVQGCVARNRQLLYGGSTGLRIIAFHTNEARDFGTLKRTVEWCRGRFPMASPADADALFEGRYVCGPSDQILLSFDDGFERDFEAAKWLAGLGIRAIFFVVPSLVGRTVKEYFRFHERHGVQAFIDGKADERGLSVQQIHEMIAMGHRIGAHNFAHRDLGQLHSAADIEYEIARAVNAIDELTNSRCCDFGVAFGQPENISPEAAAYLLEHCPRVYAGHRGLNVPGKTPRFLLRHACGADQPMAFVRLCIEGGADHHLANRAREMQDRVGTLPAARSEAHACVAP